jgi:signal transduction histidine kinase
VAVLATLVVGLAATKVVSAVVEGPDGSFRPSFYLTIEVTATLAGLLASYLVYFRFRRSGKLDDALLSCALAILAFSNFVFGVLPATVVHQYPNRYAAWATIGGRLLGSALLAAAAFAPAQRLELPRRFGWVLLGSSVVALPVLGGAVGHIRLGLSPDEAHSAALALHLMLVAVLAVAAFGFVRRAEQRDDELMTWLAVSATLGALAGFNFALHPTLQAGWVYTGDGFSLLFYFGLAAGAAREISSYWRDSVEAALLQERRRIARDLHDGLTQELAYIVRRAGRTLQEEPHSPLARQVVNAAERALDESRRVIAALTRPLDEPLVVVLAEAVKEVADRVGTIAALSLDRRVTVTPDVREALVRIAREAVTNAARHGEAGIVRVELEIDESRDTARLRIVDDGCGFDALAKPRTRNGGFGLVSMSERAQAIGATFHVESSRGVGTTVEVEVPA